MTSLHTRPPTRVLRGHPATLPVLLAAAVVLGALAGHDDGRLLVPVDRPVAEAAVGLRSPAWDRAMTAASAFGGVPSVAAGMGAAVLLVWRRCRTLALALVVAGAVRPAVAVALKELVGRPRPDLDPLVVGHGPSFPSGHVLAAVALWGLLPPVVAVFQ